MLVNFLAATTITAYSSFQFTVDPYEKIQHTDPARLLPTLFRTYLPVKNTQKIASHLHYPMAVSYFFHGNKFPGKKDKSIHHYIFSIQGQISVAGCHI